MILVIAEKEQLGRAIAAAIDGSERESSSVIYKGDYCVTWASGHLLTLKEPQDYDPSYSAWDLGALPIYFPNWEMKPKEGRERRIEQIRGLIDKADSIIHAGDPDEEGQLIVDELLNWCGNTKPVFRIATSDTSLPALKKALAEKTPNNRFVSLGRSAYARSVADITFGINMSRFFTLNNQPAVLTVGRVQTPTLGLVVARDQLIESHKKILYYTVHANLAVAGKVIPCKYEPAKNDPNLTDGRILAPSYAKSRVAMLANETYDKVEVTKKTQFVQPPLPVDLVELQTYCGRKFGYSPQEVLDTTQTLRSDKYDCITYNRSSCRYLSDNHFDEAPDTMATVIRNIGAKPKGLDMTIRSKCFDSERVNKAAHFAIIPQNVAVDIKNMTEQERNVYLTIVKYYMAQFMPPQKKLITRLVVDLPDGGHLACSATEVLEKGWALLFAKDEKNHLDEDDADEDDAAKDLCSIPEGKYRGSIKETTYTERETKPPARYTQTSLVKDMNSISKYVDDPKVKALLLEKDKDDKDANGSIGTVATQSSIITGLIQHGFLEEDKKKHLISTPLGRELIRILPDEAKKPDLTAFWWAIQEDIRSGAEDYTILSEDVLALVKKVLRTQYPTVDQSKIPDSMKKRGKREPLGACPRCGQPVIEGKRGYGCSGWKDGCKFVIWKTMPKSPVMKNVTFTPKDAKDFLDGTPVLKTNLFSPKTGNTFAMHLRLEDDPNSEYGPNIVFMRDDETDPDSLLVIGKCPRCGRNVVEKANNFPCIGRDNGCNFIIWKKPKGSMFANVTFSAANVRDFLAGRKVKKTNLMSQKTGKAFEAYLTMVDDPANIYGPRFELSFPKGKKQKPK